MANLDKEHKYSIYKIVCLDPKITSCYVGSTRALIQRRYDHKRYCNKPSRKEYNDKVYRFIRDNGGWENWKIVTIGEPITCKKRRAEELAYDKIRELKAVLNSNFPTSSPKQDNVENVEAVKSYKKQYYIKNREAILKKQSQKFICNCGGSFTRRHKAEHEKGKKHKEYILSQEKENENENENVNVIKILNLV